MPPKRVAQTGHGVLAQTSDNRPEKKEKKAAAAIPKLYALVVDEESLCGCGGGDPSVNLFASIEGARAEVRRQVGHGHLKYSGPAAGEKKAEKDLMAGVIGSEKYFIADDADEDGDEDGITEHWNEDGTGSVRRTEEFCGCGSANVTWTIREKAVGK